MKKSKSSPSPEDLQVDEVLPGGQVSVDDAARALDQRVLTTPLVRSPAHLRGQLLEQPLVVARKQLAWMAMKKAHQKFSE